MFGYENHFVTILPNNKHHEDPNDIISQTRVRGKTTKPANWLEWSKRLSRKPVEFLNYPKIKSQSTEQIRSEE